MKRNLIKISIEIFAVFIGITLAFFIEDYRETKKQRNTIITYFDLLDKELSSDTVFLTAEQSCAFNQLSAVDSLQFYLIQNDLESASQHLSYLDSNTLYDSKAPYVEILLNSNSFSEIYDTVIFSELNSLLLMQKQFDQINELVHEQLQKLNSNFIFKIRDFTSGRLNFDSPFQRNEFLNNLQLFKSMLLARYFTMYAMRENTLRLIFLLKEEVSE